MAGLGQNIGKGASTGAAIGSIVPGLGTAVGAGIGALGGLAVGGAQYLKGKQVEEDTTRPEYQIPQEVLQNLTQAQQMELQGTPEAQKQQYLSNLQQGTAYGLSQISSRRGGLAGVAAASQNLNKGYSNLLAQDASARIQNQQGLMAQRQNVANYRDQEFQSNQLNPYYENVAQSQGLMGAGMQNINTQIGNLGYQGGQVYDAYQANKNSGVGSQYSPMGTTTGLNAMGQEVSAMPGILPINTNQPNTGGFGGFGANLPTAGFTGFTPQSVR